MNFTQILIDWYSIHKRELPWRQHREPYVIWLSEIIMQQTQIAQGLPYYVKFTAAYPTIFVLAAADEEAILKLWQGLGYYSRARNLHATAKYIAHELNGVFPEDYDTLIKLKGIGDYTASAIASICYDAQTAVVDGNVYRVLSRYFGIHIPINSSKGIKYFKELAQSLLPKNNVGNYNQAIMDFGSSQCKPNNPDCLTCPLNSGCMALKKSQVKMLPVKNKKSKIKRRFFNFLVFISEDGETMLEKRTSDGIWKNMYQFPLVETKSRLSATNLELNMEFKQRLPKTHYSITLFNDKEIVHKLSHQHLHTSFWIINVKSIKNNAISTEIIHKYPVPILVSRFIDTFGF